MGFLLCRGEDWGIVASKVTVSVKPHGSRQCQRGFGVSYKVYLYCLIPGVKGGGVRGERGGGGLLTVRFTTTVHLNDN